ncbi:MAG: MBL fold metallo-hydrolase [Dehalococcoidia bacterium]
MRITFCGTAMGGVTATRATTCIHVREGDSGLLLDCGPGTLPALFRTGLALPKSPYLVFSHLHMDHCHGFAEWLAHMVFPFGVLPAVFGPPGTREYIRRAAHLTSFVTAPPGADVGTEMDVPVMELEDEGDISLAEGVRLRSEVVPHAPGIIAMAHRLELADRAIVYSGDTQAIPSTLVPLSEGADLLIHEAYSEAGLDDWLAGQEQDRADRVRLAVRRTHTPVADAARIAREAGVKRLVLTHLCPGEKPDRLAREAAAIFPGEVLVADDGLALDL